VRIHRAAACTACLVAYPVACPVTYPVACLIAFPVAYLVAYPVACLGEVAGPAVGRLHNHHNPWMELWPAGTVAVVVRACSHCTLPHSLEAAVAASPRAELASAAVVLAVADAAAVR
jgi:hypothetical protein